MSTPVIHRIDREPVQFVPQRTFVWCKLVRASCHDGWVELENPREVCPECSHWMHSDTRPTIDPTAEPTPAADRAKKASDFLFAKWVTDPNNDGGYVMALNAEQTEELFRDITRELRLISAEPASPVPSGEPTAEEMLDWLNALRADNDLTCRELAYIWGEQTSHLDLRQAISAAMRGSKEATK